MINGSLPEAPSPREGSRSRARAWLVVRANRHVTQLTQRGDARDPLRDTGLAAFSYLFRLGLNWWVSPWSYAHATYVGQSAR